MRRMAGLLSALALLTGITLTAVPAAASAGTPAATGKVTVTIRTQNGMAANVWLAGHGRLVFAKPPAGTGKSRTVQVPAGRYRVLPEAVVYRGRLYNAARHSVLVSAGHTRRITVWFHRIRAAHNLRLTNLTKTSVAMTWSPPARLVDVDVVRRHTAGIVPAWSIPQYALRRTSGGVPAAGPGRGVAVRVRGRRATDTGLKPGHRYSYALFTRMCISSHRCRRWSGPLTITVGTATGAGNKTATYIVAPGTLLATSRDVSSATPTGSGVMLTLAPGVKMPVIGSAVVLPISASLPGGFLGQVTGISPDGTITLASTGLSAAFQYYDINLTSFAGPTTPLVPASTASTATPANESCVGGSGSLDFTFNPSLRLSGSFHAGISTKKYGFIHIPTGASLSISLIMKASGPLSVDASASVTCEAPFEPVVKQLTVDPIPIAFVIIPTAELSANAGVQITNLGATVTGGVSVSGHIDLHRGASFSGSHYLTAKPLTPNVTENASVGATLGGTVIVGPGGGTPSAGVIAGIAGEFDPLQASFGPVFAQSPNACLKAEAALYMSLGLTARAWLKSWSISATVTIPALTYSHDYPGSPWYFPDKCYLGQ